MAVKTMKAMKPGLSVSISETGKRPQKGKLGFTSHYAHTIDNYMAIFKIDEESKTVYVVTVQYQGRDI